MELICPNKNLQEWQELKAAIPDMAYVIWNLNKGEGIDRAPNGAPSILFQSLLDELGDRTAAIHAKANVYRQSFFRWFGDWINHPESASKMVDENGEPRVFFHGGAKAIEAFKLSSETQSATGYGYYTEPGTGRQIPIDSNRTMFFSTSKGVAQSYRILNSLQTALKLERRVLDIVILFNQTGRIKVNKQFIESTDEFYKMLDELSYFNPRFSKLKDYIKKIRETGGRLNEKESKAAGEMFKDVLNVLKQFERWQMNLSDWVDIVPRAHKLLERYNNPEGIKRLLNGEIPQEILYEWDIYKKKEKNREKQGLSKIANYEDLYFTLTDGGGQYFIYDGNRLKALEDDNHENFFVTDATEERLQDFINRTLARNEKDQERLDNNEQLKFFFSRTDLYPVFLNVRDPLIHDYEGTHQGQGYKESQKHSFGYIAARQVDKAINDGNDGVVYENLYDPFLADNVGVFAPNQIKSIYNVGTFYTDDNRIKYSLPLQDVSDVDLDDVHSSTYLERFRDFLDRLNITVEDSTTEQNILDLSRKIVYLADTDDRSLALLQARIAYQLLDQDTRNKLDNQFLHSRNNERYVKRKGIGRYSLVENERIVNDIADAILGRQNEISKDNSLWQKIKNILFDLLSKIIKHRAIYQNTVERIAQEVTNRYSPYFNLMINENTEIKQLNVDLLKSSEHYPVYQVMINSGASLAGSAGIRLQGTLYRKGEETFHDLDFTKDYDSFSWKVRVYNRELWQDYYKYIREEYNIPDSVQRIDSKKVPKRIRKDAYRYAKQIMLGKVREAFKNTNMYRQLSNTYKVIDIKNAFISNTTGMCVTYTVDGFPVDIFYTDYHDMYNINGVVIDDFSVAFKAKLIMKRDKDMRDIINFKSYAIQKYNESIAHTSVPYQSKPQITVNVQEIEQVDDKLQNVLNFLQKRFPQLKLQWIDAEQIPNGIRKDANAFVVDGVVYLVRGRVTPKTSIEEFLHPLVEALYEDNPTQFNALVAEAKLTYPKLWRAIQATYKGFSENTKEQELVAHALSEALNNRFENEANKSVFKQLVNGFVAWLKEVIAKAINYFESKFTKKSNNLKNLTLEDLADSIFNSDKEYRLKLDGDVKYNISEETTQMLDKARKGIQQRIRSLRHYSNPNIRQIQQMEQLLDDLNKLDAIEGTQELLQYIINSLPDAAAFLQQPMDDINTKQLVQMRRDYLSFFIPILQDLQYLIDTTDEFKSLPDYDKFAYSVEHALTLSNQIINKFNNIIKAKCKQMLLDYGEAAGSPTIKETVAELDNPANDLNWLETFLGLNSSAGNEVIRIMTDILNTAINKTKRETFSDGMRLVDLYNAAKQSNPDIDVQKLLQEVDENGQTTGYFTRSRNWGKFYRDQQKFLDNLEKELGIERSPEGELIFKDNEQKREYVKRRTYWQLEHGVLKYTKKYYDAKFKMSMEAQEALDEVNHAIQLIRSRAQVGKHFLAHLLTSEERAQLKDLLKQKAYLSSEYDYNGNKKEGKELQIAQEIAQFREYIGEYLNYDVDWDRYNRDARYMIKKYGVDSKEYKDWLVNSTEEAYDQEFYDELEELFGTASKEVQSLRKKRARLLAPYKNSNNKEDLDDVPYEVRQQILEIDQELAGLRHKLDKEQFERFSKIALIKYTDKYYEDADKARAEGRYDEWYEQNHYTNEDGYSVAASYYTYLVPKNPAYYIRVPNYFYKKASSESPLINSEFDVDGPYVQPSKREYDNTEAWNKIQNNPTIKALYDALTEAMRDANNRISFFETNRDGRLPQISGRMMATLARADNKFEALKYMVKDSFMVKDDDVDYVEEYQYRNDGTPIKLIPTRFIKQLDNPAMITSDVVGSVIQFIEMSRNYQNMSDIQNDLELLMYRLGQITIKTKRGTKVGSETNIYKKAESLLDMVLYGKRSDRLIIHGVDVTKALNKLYNYISLSNLAYNVWAMGTNYVTGQGTLDIEAIAGKYFNASDVTFAKREFLQHFGNIAANIGNVNNKDKVSLLMQLLQISRSNQETFDRLDQSRVLRGINQHFWYNGYSAGDFCVKGQLMLAVLHSYKLVDGEFLTEEQYVARSTDKNAARKHFKALQTTLYDMMDVVDGDIKIVAPEALKQATQRALTKAQKKIQVLAARIDGNITDTDRAMIHQGVLTKFLTMHRNFMIVGLQERLKKKQFNYSTGTMEGGVYADFLRYFSTVCKCFGQIFTQGNINFIGNCLSQYKELDTIEQYNVRRTFLDLMNIALWSVAIAPFFVFLAEDGGDDDWGLQAMAYLSMRISFEFRSLYNPLELTNLLNSPSAAVSTLGLLFNMIKLIFPGTYLRENGIFSDVKSGAYKGWPRILRNIIKMTPAKNVYEFFSTQGIENKRTYLENQLMF